jgi:DnaJ-class molecular chaperone
MPELMDFYTRCTGCGGTGIRHYWDNHVEITEDPCSICNGTKISESKRGSGMDATLIQQILTNQAAIIEDLDYIHGKVTAIWNQVKP